MSAKRKICVVTGTRAEYGLLYWLMKEISGDPDLQLQIIATGMHLSPEFGLTYKQIEDDGFSIDAKVEMLISSDSMVGVTKSIGLGVIGFADALSCLKPDILVVLGDRFEMLAAAQAALVGRVPLAHIHGGETTEGAFDEGIRHAITKMAQWHFVAADPYRKRVIQLGEAPDRVFNFGAPGLDYLERITWIERGELEASLEISLRAPVFLVSYHPATLGRLEPMSAMKELLSALSEFKDATTIFTYPNADTGGRSLIPLINQWVMERGQKAKAFTSLGQRRYLSMMRETDLIIGNSSSALIEASALKIGAVNIGDRQKGRLKASNIVDAEEEKNSIISAINLAISDDFKERLHLTTSLYGSGDTSRRIKNVLKKAQRQEQKIFFDIEHAN